jgi:hypothetical protein
MEPLPPFDADRLRDTSTGDLGRRTVPAWSLVMLALVAIAAGIVLGFTR